MAVGLTVPKGFLPVYSVDEYEEAQHLVVLTCQRDLEGNYYSAELALARSKPVRSRADMTMQLDVLQAFSDRVAKAHDLLKSYGHCKCQPLEPLAGVKGGKRSGRSAAAKVAPARTRRPSPGTEDRRQALLSPALLQAAHGDKVLARRAVDAALSSGGVPGSAASSPFVQLAHLQGGKIAPRTTATRSSSPRSPRSRQR